MRAGCKNAECVCRRDAYADSCTPVLPDSEESLVLNIVADGAAQALVNAESDANIMGFHTIRAVEVRPAANGKWQARIEVGR